MLSIMRKKRKRWENPPGASRGPGEGRSVFRCDVPAVNCVAAAELFQVSIGADQHAFGKAAGVDIAEACRQIRKINQNGTNWVSCRFIMPQDKRRLLLGSSEPIF